MQLVFVSEHKLRHLIQARNGWKRLISGAIAAYLRLQMRHTAPPISRRARQRLHTVTAVLSLSLWLLLTVAEAYSPLHAWIHGGAIPDNDECAVVAIAHGQVDSPVGDVPAVAQFVWIEITPHVKFSAYCPAIGHLPSGRAPPVLPAVS